MALQNPNINYFEPTPYREDAASLFLKRVMAGQQMVRDQQEMQLKQDAEARLKKQSEHGQQYDWAQLGQEQARDSETIRQHAFEEDRKRQEDTRTQRKETLDVQDQIRAALASGQEDVAQRLAAAYGWKLPAPAAQA